MCICTPHQLVLPSQLLADPQVKELIGVPVTQAMVDLLCVILDCTDDLKGPTANQVVKMWLAHFEQCGKFQTTVAEADREMLHFTDVKAVQTKDKSTAGYSGGQGPAGTSCH